MEMRAHELFGVQLASKCRRSLSRQHYESAKKLAAQNCWLEDSARIQLLIIAVDLESDDDPQIGSLRNLKKAAKDRGYTAQELLAVWMHYLEQTREHERGLIAARSGSVASVEYFHSLLKTFKAQLRNEASA
jgi:hypothetical protein